MNWELVRNITASFQSALTAGAIIGSLVWGYFRFIRFRILRPRLEFSFDWSRADIAATNCVSVLTIKIKNVGNAKVDLRRKNKHRCFLKYALIEVDPVPVGLELISLPGEDLEHLDTVFSAHKWIEPGETIDDVKIFDIQRQRAVAVQFEVTIFGEKKWSACAAFPLIGENKSACPNSEDEQDEYQELEAAKEELKNNLVRAGRVLRRLPIDDRANLEDLVRQAKSLLQGIKERSVGGNTLGQLERLTEQFQEYLGGR